MRKKEEIKQAVGHAAAAEAFDFLPAADHEVVELKRLARDGIAMEEYMKSGCDERAVKTVVLIQMC